MFYARITLLFIWTTAAVRGRQAPDPNPASNFCKCRFRPSNQSKSNHDSRPNPTIPLDIATNIHNGRKSRRQPEQWWARWYWRQAQRGCWGIQCWCKCSELHQQGCVSCLAVIMNYFADVSVQRHRDSSTVSLRTGKPISFRRVQCWRR